MPQAGDGVHALPMPRESDGVGALPVPGDNDGVRALPMPQYNDGVHALPMPQDSDGVHALPMPRDNDGVRALPVPGANDGVRALPMPGSNDSVRALPMPGANDGVRALPMPGSNDDVRALPMPGANDDVRALPMPRENDGVRALPFPTRADAVARQGFGDTSVPAGQFARVAQVATLAQVAQVAQVATVASVAQTARVSETGQSAPSAPVDVTARPESTIAGAPMRERDAGSAPQNGERQSSGERRDRDKGAALLSALADREAVGGARAMLSREVPSLDVRDGLSTAPVAGLSRSDATERIARVLRMQESVGDRPLSSVLLRLDHPEGGEDRIRIDLRGQSVGATLDMRDPRVAEQLRAHAPELQQALQRQGLEGEAMVVRSASRSTDSAAYSLSAGGAERDQTRAASATASDGGGSTAKDSRNPPRAQHEREGTDQQRSRQRRDSKGEQK
ncbi:MAG: flagellar hook-length control protein FliK, partial [Gemmatimonadaceae bacterium]|nr:flagellar hook-length control protein FliK [Gemmatimonadaceae bacterium]